MRRCSVADKSKSCQSEPTGRACAQQTEFHEDLEVEVSLEAEELVAVMSDIAADAAKSCKQLLYLKRNFN